MNIKFFSFQFSVFSVCLAFSAEPLPLSTSYWNDPAFLKSFNGSYRIEARIEPNVSTEERSLLIELQELMADGKRETALQKLQASELTDDSAALTFNLANLYFETGETEKAIASYRAALKAYPSFRRAHSNLAMALVRENDLEKALEHLTEAIRLGDSSGSTYGLLGYCRLSRNEYASALQAYRFAQITEPETTEWKAGIAQCLQYLDQKHEAIALLDEIIRQHPTEASYALLKSNLHLDLDQPKLAAKTLELPFRLGKLDPDATLLLANIHLRAERKSPAMNAIEAAFAPKDKIDEDTETPTAKPSLTAVLRLIQTASSQADWPLVKDLLERVQSDQPDRRLQLAKARYLIASEEDPAAGAALLRALTEKDPTDGEALVALAKYLTTENQPGSAELLFQRATKDLTTAYEAHVELARLFVSQTRYADALEAIDAALALNPSEQLQTYRQALKQTAEAAR